MPISPVQEREARQAWAKWWFQFIERFLMVGALGTARRLSGSFLLELLYVLSLVMLAGWTNDSLASLSDRVFPPQDSPEKLQRFSRALIRVVSAALAVLVVVGLHLLILKIAEDLTGAGRRS